MNSGRLDLSRWKGRGAVVLAAVVFVLAPWQSHGDTSGGQPITDASSPALHLLRSGEDGIVLEFRVPAWQLSTRQAGLSQLDEIGVPGFELTSDPGKPRLPVKYVALGVPPGVQPRVEVLEASRPRVKAGHRLASSPSSALNLDVTRPPSVATLTGPPELQLQPATGDEFYPADLVEIVREGRMRSQPFVQLRLNPFRYHPEKQELEVYEYLKVAVTFDRAETGIKSGFMDEGPFESALRSWLWNYEEAKRWRVPRGAQNPLAPQAFFAGPRFRIEVKEEGMYELRQSDLLQDPNIGTYPLSTFQLYEDFNLSAASEVALDVSDVNGNNQLDAGDALRFYGRPAPAGEQRYTGTRVYWLVAGPGRGPGKRMATRPAGPGIGAIAPDFPATIHAEQNHQYWSDLPELGGSSAHWYWSYLVNTDPSVPLDREFTISAPEPSSMPHQVTLRAQLAGYSSDPLVNKDHSASVFIGNTLAANAVWDGQAGFTVQGSLASSALSSGVNSVRVRIDLLPGITADAVFVDWFEVDYRRAFRARNDRLTFQRPAGFSEYRVQGFNTTPVGVYDVTNPLQPVRLTGTQTDGLGTLRFRDTTPTAQKYVAAALQIPALLQPASIAQVSAGDDLRASTNGADYVIITHVDFTAAAGQLAGHRAADFTTKVVQVQDIYNQFGNGVLDPEAIRDFLAYAVTNWSPSPRYVVLLGDGTYDYRNYLGGTRKNFIPPYLAMVDPWLGETADENFYAAVIGPDIVPDLYVGRLPANTFAEASAMVSKIISYESGPAPTTPESALLVADDFEPDRNAGNFPLLSDGVANNGLPASYLVQKVYLGQTHATASAARSAIVSKINQGQRFVNYIGHAGVVQWAGEIIFATPDVAGLTNIGQYPVVLGMTCLEGSFHSAQRDALAEELVRAANKGAVASWSATGLGVATGHDALNHGFYNALFQSGVRRLGPAVMAGKSQLLSTGVNLDLVHTFGLLGDPATDTRIQGTCTSLQADVTGDGVVDIHDLTTLSSHWRTFIGAPFDQDGNSFIDVVDFALVAAAWNSLCGG